jgi:hypothetical protein
MKGIVFTEFLELIEEKFGYEMADDIIDESNLPSGGVYTSVGTYSHHELITMVGALSEKTGLAVEDLVITFGEHLLERFYQGYPQFFSGVNSCFEFLDTIENRVHVEVKKLYPEAELPTFLASFPHPNTMHLVYTSKRPFSALAYGLIKGSAHHFGENIAISMDDQSTAELTQVLFTLDKQA